MTFFAARCFVRARFHSLQKMVLKSLSSKRHTFRTIYLGATMKFLLSSVFCLTSLSAFAGDYNLKVIECSGLSNRVCKSVTDAKAGKQVLKRLSKAGVTISDNGECAPP